MLMNSKTLATLASLTLGTGLLATGTPTAHAQGTFADKALSRLVGKWVSDKKGRTISFMMRDYNGVFEDEIEPGYVLSGAFRQDDAGAGYVLTYSAGFQCRYNVSVMSGTDGNEMNLRLVSSSQTEHQPRFRCIEGGMKRTRQ